MRVAPALQGVQKKLERELAKSNLYHALNHRMSRSELEACHIIEPSFVCVVCVVIYLKNDEF